VWLLRYLAKPQPEDRAARARVFARMDEAAKFGSSPGVFSGGEPLKNPNMPDYIEYAAGKGFYTSMRLTAWPSSVTPKPV